MDQAVREKLDALIKVADGENRPALAWLREWPEAPLQKNLAGIVERPTKRFSLRFETAGRQDAELGISREASLDVDRGVPRSA